MISELPTPWEDIIITTLSSEWTEMKKHYYKDVNICRTRKCNYCNKIGITHFHHIIPRRNLGAHKKENIVELCPSCHKKAENGLITINRGCYFKKAIKKKRKFLLKLYRNGIELKYPNYNRNLFNEIIKKHLSIDSSIKELISRRMFDRIKEIKKEYGIVSNSSPCF